MYWRDTKTGVTTLISHKPDGTGNGRAVLSTSISDDGRFVVYPLRVGVTSIGMRLVLWDRTTDTTTTVSKSPAGDLLKGAVVNGAISGDGSAVVVQLLVDSPDTSVHTQLYRYDVATGQSTQLFAGDLVYPVDTVSPRPAISGNGRYVSYVRMSGVPDAAGFQPTQLIRLDTQTGGERVVWTTQPSDRLATMDPSLNASGRYVAFAYRPTVNGNALIAVYDATTRSVQQVSFAAGGGDPDGSGYEPDLNGDGSVVSFGSNATNMQATPTDIAGTYVYDRATGTTQRIDVNRQGIVPRVPSGLSTISRDGGTVLFVSSAGNLANGTTGGSQQVYRWSRPAG